MLMQSVSPAELLSLLEASTAAAVIVAAIDLIIIVPG
jgi:hypothetical protein